MSLYMYSVARCCNIYPLFLSAMFSNIRVSPNSAIWCTTLEIANGSCQAEYNIQA